MGFTLPKTTTRIEFDDSSPYHGAEVVMSLDITMEKAFELQALAESLTDAADLFDAIDSLLVSWNLEDDAGQPIPVSTGTKGQPMPFVVALFQGYHRALAQVVSVDAPFALPSNSGGT